MKFKKVLSVLGAASTLLLFGCSSPDKSKDNELKIVSDSSQNIVSSATMNSAGIGSVLTDPAVFSEIAGKTFQNNVYSFAGGPGVTMVINSDGTFSETNERISDQGGVDISRFTGQLSMPEKIDDYTWKVSVASTSMTQPAGITISESQSTKHVVNPFAGFYGSSEFYIASPEKPLEDYPEFFQTHANPMPDAFKNNFGDSYILYSADGTTCLGVMNPNWN